MRSPLTDDCRLSAPRRHDPFWTRIYGSADELQSVRSALVRQTAAVLGERVLVPTDAGGRAQSCRMI